MEKNLYVLCVAGDRPWVLDLDPCDLNQAKQKIAWQAQGGADRRDFRICAYDRDSNVFADVNAPADRYQPDIGPYTKEVWDAFCSRLNYDPSEPRCEAAG